MVDREVSDGQPRPLRILHVFGSLNCGGAEMRTLEVVRYLRTHRPEVPLQVDFCALSGQRGTLDEKARELGCRVHHLAIRGGNFPARFREVLRQGRYNVLHSHVFYPSGVLALLACSAGVPRRVVHFRSASDGRSPTILRRLIVVVLKTLIHRFATDILAVSQSAMEQAWSPRWKEDPRCRVIYNGLNVEGFPSPADPQPRNLLCQLLGIDPTARVLIHVGRECVPKNHSRLLDIFEALRRADGSAHFALVGELAPQSRLPEEIARRHLAGCVYILGRRDDVPTLLAGADAMLFPSLWEGLPGAVLEALAVGTPVVASDIPAHREIAAMLPGLIELVPLTEPDATWSQRLRCLPRPSVASRRRAREAFAASPFSLATCASALLEVWQAEEKPAKPKWRLLKAIAPLGTDNAPSRRAA